MRNRGKLKTAAVVILMLAVACTIGAESATALSAEGASVLDAVVSVGSNFGIDLSGVIPTSTTAATETVDANAESDLQRFLSTLSMSVVDVLDLVNYIQQGGSFESWIVDNYGDSAVIPDSLENISVESLMIYITNYAVGATSETTATTDKYRFTTASEEETRIDAQSDQTEGTTVNSVLSANVENEIEPESESGTYEIGDVNGDGRITVSDARLALRAGAQLIELNDIELYAADVNGDGKVSAKDARSILRYVANLTSSF